MEELINLVEDLKLELDNISDIKRIKVLNNSISKDRELLNNINKYRISHDINTKKDIMNNSLFREYKELEFNINIIILELNKRLKCINYNNNRGKCHEDN